ncbi:glycosyltransferase [Luteimicrobium xylanilyticum]|uniref:1,2-diacylglycerol 3-alpha-glucosyltransferase n=1 Tax=Luteimicrobium xylanilyticum TaxID=1133546 RepID=A0A5P9Q9F0_9MICO|nr:glycosyltransferase [Luteimicrobium xylanilyticum]QFU98073.1 1,2-diacylglycerol 3-alpha-glucosyltransferase [Luteimicrobium xylanilyticum]
MRVLQILGSSAGGVGRHVGQAADALRAAGHDVVVAGPASVRPLVGEDVAFEAVEITDRPRPGDVAVVRQLAALRRGADVVHAHGLRAGALAVLAVRGLGRAPDDGARTPRVVVTLHNLPVGGRAVRGVSAVLERVVGRGADVVLGVSPDLVALATARGARRAELALVPAPRAVAAADGAARARRTREALGVTGDERLLVTVGRLAPQKGLGAAVAAARELARTPHAFRWVVAGDGPLRGELEAEIRASGVPVELLGARDDVGALLAAADVAVSTARWEGQPLWLQEALAQGAAIVATDVGGTRAVVGDGAVLVPSQPRAALAGSLAASIAGLLSDDAARDALRARARARAARLPTGADVVEQLEAVYRPGRAHG